MDWQKIVEDYSQLANAYPNAKKFAEMLRANVERNVPAQAELENPDYMQQRALNYMSPMAGAIKAYHGTPHEFDRFDMSKIGTGEGAQAYGYGLYFAENPEIAEGYKKALSGGTYVDKRGVPVQPNEIASDIYEAARKGGMNVEDASDASSFWSLYLRDGDKMSNAPGFKYIKDVIDGRGISFKDKGNLYEASIQWPDAAREAADPLGEHHLLDWDKPLREQSEYVKKALQNIGKNKNFTKQISANNKNNTSESSVIWEELYGNPKTTRKNTYGKLSEFLGGSHMPTVSNNLKELGIPGIKYLDQGSRGVDGGTSNYVMFGDEYPQIVNRASTLAELLRGK